MRKNELLKCVDLVLERHKVCDGLVSMERSIVRALHRFSAAHPSLGSFIDLRLMYSSYSKRPDLG